MGEMMNLVLAAVCLILAVFLIIMIRSCCIARTKLEEDQRALKNFLGEIKVGGPLLSHTFHSADMTAVYNQLLHYALTDKLQDQIAKLAERILAEKQ